jgi:transposase
MGIVRLKKLNSRELRKMLNNIISSHGRNKILAALALEEGRTVTEVARLFGVTRQTIYNWLETSKRDFVESPPRNRMGRPPKWTRSMDRLLDKSLKHRPNELGLPALNWTIPVFVTYFYRETGHKFSGSTFHRKLHAHRPVMRWKRPRYSLIPDPEFRKKSVPSVPE